MIVYNGTPYYGNQNSQPESFLDSTVLNSYATQAWSDNRFVPKTWTQCDSKSLVVSNNSSSSVNINNVGTYNEYFVCFTGSTSLRLGTDGFAQLDVFGNTLVFVSGDYKQIFMSRFYVYIFDSYPIDNRHGGFSILQSGSNGISGNTSSTVTGVIGEISKLNGTISMEVENVSSTPTYTITVYAR